MFQFGQDDMTLSNWIGLTMGILLNLYYITVADRYSKQVVQVEEENQDDFNLAE